MNRKSKLIFITVLIFIIGILHSQEKNPEFPVLKGPYLGQKPPGMVPEMFAPGLISTELHDDAAPAFSPDGKEVYFRIVYKINEKYYGTIFRMKQVEGIWSGPEVAPFSGKHMDGGAKFSLDGKKLYFSSNRGENNTGSSDNSDLWYVERTGSGWKEPEIINKLNTGDNELYPCESPVGMLFWTVELNKGEWPAKIFRSKIINNEFIDKEEVNLFPDISEPVRIYSFSPNGSYVIFTMLDPDNDIELYVSFKKRDATWGSPINLGKNINSEYMDKAPGISPDGKYLFFVSSRPHKNKNPEKLWKSDIFKGHQRIFRADIYWVDAKIIEELKPDELR